MALHDQDNTEGTARPAAEHVEATTSPSSISSRKDEDHSRIPDADEIRPVSVEEQEEDEREATELHHVTGRRSSECSTETDHQQSWSALRLRRQKPPKWYDPLVKFWAHNVSVTVPVNARRDHLGR